MTKIEKKLDQILARIERLESQSAKMMDTKAAAEFLCMKPSTLNKITRPGNMLIPVAVFGGKKKIFMKSDLEHFVKTHKARAIAA